jgi:hypothetical protein
LSSRRISFKNLRKVFADTVREARPDMNVVTEPKIHPSYKPDLVLSDKKTKILVELKSSTYPQKSVQTLYQIIGYDKLFPDRFDTILVIIPESTSTSPKFRSLIEKVQRKLPKLQVMTYNFENNKLVFNKITEAPGPIPEKLASNLPPKSTVTKRRRPSLSAPKSMRVVRYLLAHTKTTQTEIANKVRVSIGLVNKVVSYLLEEEIAKYKKRQLVLLEPWKLLNEVSWSRSMEKLRISNWFMADLYPKIEDLEVKIKDVFGNMNLRYALTLFSAAKRYTPYMKKYDTVQLYVDNLDEINQASVRKKLRPVEKGQFRLEIFEPDSMDILRDSETLGGFRMCSKIQTVIDLYCYGTIGRELAIELYSKIRGSEF